MEKANTKIKLFYGGSLTCYFDEKHILKLFSLSSCQYVSTIPEKINCMLLTFEKWTFYFIRVCMERMMDHQYRENGARNIHSNYNQMRAYVKCSPNQFKKNYALLTSLSSNRQNFEEPGKVLAVTVSEFTR